MRTITVYSKVSFLFLILWVSLAGSSFAEEAKEPSPVGSATNVFRQDERSLTPAERIKLSELKVQENPSLRGRWTRKSQEPASEGSMLNDNLAEKVLLQFREDEALAKLPVKIKTRSSRGVVTLEGVVNNADERVLIEDKVGKMDGVKKVVNELKIKTSDKDLLD